MVVNTEKYLGRASTIEDVCIDVNNCARGHGWWEDPDRPIEQQRLLFASEVLEAFERFRKAPAETMHQEVAEELVDVLIRLYDAQAQGETLGSSYLDFYEATLDYLPEMKPLTFNPSLVEIEEWCAQLVGQLSEEDLASTRFDSEIISLLDDMLMGIAKVEATTGETYNGSFFQEMTTNATMSVALFCAVHGLSFSQLLLDKMRKNWGRPYRHGGLRA